MKNNAQPDGRVWCPRCNQGWVMDVVIKQTNQRAFLCDECDALWFSLSEIAQTGFVDFTTHMASLGGKGLWTEIVVSGHARYPAL